MPFERRLAMSERLYRAQILIEQRQRKTLAQIARQEGRSISDVARELIRLGLEARNETPEMRWRKRDRALARAAELRAAILRRRGGRPLDIDPAELIRSMREERDAAISRGLTDHRD
jgi:hypothetical protein